MKKDSRSIKLGNGDVRYEVTISTSNIADGEMPKTKAIELIRALADNIALLQVNGQFFQKLVIQNDGEKWLAKLEVTQNEA